MKRVLAVVCFLFATACGADGLWGLDDPPDAGLLPDAGEEEQPVWSWTRPECDTPVVRDVTFALSSGGRGQIAPSLSFDGRLYASWSQPPADDPDDSNFDVRARIFGCDGQPITDDIVLSKTRGANDTSSRIVAVPGGAVIAWAASGMETAPHNAVLVRAIDTRGQPRAEVRSLFPDAAAWLPDLALLPDGDVAVGLLYAPGESSFRTTFQRVDRTGQVAGDEVLTPSDGAYQGNPAIAATHDSIALVWERDVENALTSTIQTASVSGGAINDVTTVAPGRIGEYPRADGWLGEGGRAWTVFGSKRDNVYALLLEELGGTLRTELGIGGQLNFAPDVAATSDGGAVAWIAQDGVGKSLVAQRFRAGSAGLSTSSPVTVPTSHLQMHALSIVHLQDDDFAIAWTEGTSPHLAVKARIVTLP